MSHLLSFMKMCLSENSPFGVDFELVTLQMFMLKQQHYTITKGEKVKKHYRSPLKLYGSDLLTYCMHCCFSTFNLYWLISISIFFELFLK